MSAQDLAAIIADLERMPARLSALLQGLTDAQLRRKPSTAIEDFAFVEHVHHLLDIEVEGYAQRLRRTLDEDRPRLPDIDGTRLAIKRAYRQQPLAPALDRFLAARHANLARLRRVTLPQLARVAQLESTGEVTLAQILLLWRDHDAAHLSDMTQLRTLVDRT
jgi:hypothetical protein